MTAHTGGVDLLPIPNTNIPRTELRFKFARSGGHGGQNVNKVETRVELLFDVQGSTGITAEQRKAILRHLGSRIDARGILHVTAQESRSQWRNREDAVDRFVELIRNALRPRRKRIPTVISTSGRERRLDSKRRRSATKKLRRYREE